MQGQSVPSGPHSGPQTEERPRSGWSVESRRCQAPCGAAPSPDTIMEIIE